MNRRKTRPKADFGQGENGPYLRYVRVETTEAAGSQPVEVKNLRWTATSGYIVYGDAYGIGDSTTASKVTAAQQLWIVWRPDRRVWERLTSDVIPDMLVTYVGSVRKNGVVVVSGTPEELPSGTPDASDVEFVYNRYGITLEEQQPIFCIHRQGVFDDTTGIEAWDGGATDYGTGESETATVLHEGYFYHALIEAIPAGTEPGATGSEEEWELGGEAAGTIDWFILPINSTLLTVRTQYAIVTSTTGLAEWSGTEDADFTITPYPGKCILLEEITEAGEAADEWQASTSYDADEEWSGTVPGAAVDYVDFNGVPLVAGRTYDMAYPSAQTSGSALDQAEWAKAVIVRWVPQGSDIGKITMPRPIAETTLSDYECTLQNLYDEVPLRKGRVVRISSNSAIPAGPYALGEAPKVKGELLRTTDYLRELDGIDTGKILFTPDGDEIKWAGKVCAT